MIMKPYNRGRTLELSKTDKIKPTVKRKPHPKRYTDPVTGKALKTRGRGDVDKFIEEELVESGKEKS